MNVTLEERNDDEHKSLSNLKVNWQRAFALKTHQRHDSCEYLYPDWNLGNSRDVTDQPPLFPECVRFLREFERDDRQRTAKAQSGRQDKRARESKHRDVPKCFWFVISRVAPPPKRNNVAPGTACAIPNSATECKTSSPRKRSPSGPAMEAMARKGPKGERERSTSDFKIQRAYGLLENSRFVHRIDFLLTRKSAMR
jgi:hypothetical protein